MKISSTPRSGDVDLDLNSIIIFTLIAVNRVLTKLTLVDHRLDLVWELFSAPAPPNRPPRLLPSRLRLLAPCLNYHTLITISDPWAPIYDLPQPTKYSSLHSSGFSSSSSSHSPYRTDDLTVTETLTAQPIAL
ncbi:Uncharacterized protein HZ326_20908 [Fusarium oxysporum f. sp. albedinis]|nr:Uncharacterized protein HZ326_20908 [Fusarium oxysporum f. sp. albedinis]